MSLLQRNYHFRHFSRLGLFIQSEEGDGVNVYRLITLFEETACGTDIFYYELFYFTQDFRVKAGQYFLCGVR